MRVQSYGYCFYNVYGVENHNVAAQIDVTFTEKKTPCIQQHIPKTMVKCLQPTN